LLRTIATGRAMRHKNTSGPDFHGSAIVITRQSGTTGGLRAEGRSSRERPESRRQDAPVGSQTPASELQARTLIDKLDLKPPPEGGSYREIYRSGERVETARGTRSAITAIYYLLERNQISRWHVVEADEIWQFYEGSPLELLAYEP